MALMRCPISSEGICGHKSQAQAQRRVQLPRGPNSSCQCPPDPAVPARAGQDHLPTVGRRGHQGRAPDASAHLDFGPRVLLLLQVGPGVGTSRGLQGLATASFLPTHQHSGRKGAVVCRFQRPSTPCLPGDSGTVQRLLCWKAQEVLSPSKDDP